jgi:hypothetical protein
MPEDENHQILVHHKDICQNSNHVGGGGGVFLFLGILQDKFNIQY